MGLEAATYINQLVPTNPVGATDPKGQGDDHLRLLKSTIQATFPNITGPVTVTQAQLNAVGVSGITGFAAPTVDVDLAAEAPGVATTAMRSDAKLQLSQAISPSWTAKHKFTASNPTIELEASLPLVRMTETDAAANNRLWDIFANNGQLVFRAADDAFASVNIFMLVERTGAAINRLEFGNVANNPAYAFLGTGNAAFSGTITSAGVATFNKTRAAAGDYAAVLSAAAPFLGMFETAAAANNRRWAFGVSGGVLSGYALTDTEGATAAWIAVTRGSGAAISSVNFPSGSLQYGGIEVGYRGLPSRNFSANDNTVASDNGRQVRYTSTGHTFTLDSDIPTDGIVIIRNAGTGVLNIAASGTLTWFNGGGSLPTGARVLAIGGIATAQHIGGGNYEIWGNAGLS